jgi:putative heme-binding domain-containing protein
MILRAILCLGLAGAACFAQQAAGNPFASSAPDIDVGRGTFRIYCSPCHGIRAQGGRGPDLTLGVYNVGDSDAALFNVVSDGVEGTEMPGFGERMSEEAIWRILAYVRSVARRTPPSVPGDAAAGRSVYDKSGCAGCHRIGQQGGRLGPNLTRVGRSRSLEYLRQALVDPHAELTPGYGTIAVVTHEGKTFEGVERNYDNFSAQIMDANENLLSFLREEVRSMKREHRSLMPTYRQSLNNDDMRNLLAYLVSLRGEEVRP